MKACKNCVYLAAVDAGCGEGFVICNHDVCYEEEEYFDTYNGKVVITRGKRIRDCLSLNGEGKCPYFQHKEGE